MTQIDTSTEAVEALLKDVTPGPWTAETVKTSCGVCHKIGPLPHPWREEAAKHACLYDDYPPSPLGTDYMQANARFIAAARELVPALLAERDALKAEVEHLKAQAVTAYSNGLDAALGLIASLGYGENEWVDNGHEDAYRAIEQHKAEWVRHPTALSAKTTRSADDVWNEAIEAAAEACADYPRAAPDETEWPKYDEQISYSQDCIRALKRPVKGESHE